MTSREFTRVEGERYHRCRQCWTELCATTENGQQVAFNNGFVPVTQAYPHAEYCSQRGQF